MLYSPSIPAKKIQTEYKKVFEKANKLKKPIVVFAHNKPLGAVVGLDILEKLQMEEAVKQALHESKKGKTKVIHSSEELEKDLKELEQYVNDQS